MERGLERGQSVPHLIKKGYILPQGVAEGVVGEGAVGVVEGSVGEVEVGVADGSVSSDELGVAEGSVGEGDGVRIMFLAL